MRIHIEDRNPDGRGRGKVGRRTALISQAHPGEVVTLRIDRKTRNTLQGRVARLLTLDPRRIEHRCRHEHRCTGCPLLAAHPDDEAAFKLARVRSVLAGLGEEALAALAPLATPAGPFAYRYYAKQTATVRGGRVVLGSYVAGTHHVVDNAGCPVLAHELAALLEEVARRATDSGLPVARPSAGDPGAGLRHVVARQSRATGEQLVTLVTSADRPAGERRLADAMVAELPAVAGAAVLLNRDPGNALLAGEIVHQAGAAAIEEELSGFRHAIGPTSFFQVNPAAAEQLVAEALAMAGEGEACLEAFAGVGALTLPLARRFRRLVAVESSAEAVGHLRAGAAREGFDHLEAVCERAEKAVPRQLARLAPEVAVFDPPRKGLGEALTGALAVSAVRRVVLLSCDPSTLAADLPPLLAAGFRLQRVAPVDPFPRTGHVETVSLLSRPG